MSLQNFIPTVWAAGIQKELEEKYVFGALVNRNYQGDITSHGDTVLINSVGDVSIGDYVKNTTVITPEQLTSTQQQMDIDQAKYFAFYVDDVDQAQTKPKVMSEAMRKASRGLSAEADDFIRDTMLAAAGLSDTTGELESTIVAEYLASLRQKLVEADNDAAPFIVVPAWLEKLILVSYQGNSGSESVLQNGSVGRYFGFDVFVSNRLTLDGDDTNVIAGTQDGMTFAEQIVSVEAYRPESSFADAVKGLHVYGGKVTLPEALLVSKVRPKA